MPKKKNPRTPQYCRHRSTGHAYIRIDGQWFNLGKHGTPESHAEYDRLIAEWLSRGRHLPTAIDGTGHGPTVVEVIARFWQHAKQYYRYPDGSPTAEVENLRLALRSLKATCGTLSARDFGPLALKTVRQAMIDAGGSRGYINKHIRRIKLMFRWAVENEIAPPSVYHGLQAVSGLKLGRSDARETEPVTPVADQYVDAVRVHVSRQVWTIIELQRLTGMRSGEVVIMRGSDLDMEGKQWLYRPTSHKTEHHGHERVIEIGPRAQKVIRPFLKRDLEAFLFSPVDAEAERRGKLHAERKTPMSYGNRPGTNRKPRPKRTPRERYTADSLCRAIARACDKADVRAKERKNLPADSERIIPRWHPHQLRHNYATRIRKEFGVEAARILLGHRTTAVTELYAEVDRGRVRDIVSRVG